ncbi:MAG: cytochrome P450 [Cyanobacteria bacterium P01_A01_bin.123]
MSQNLLASSVPSAEEVFTGYGQDALAAMTDCADRFGEIVLPQFEDELAGLLSNSKCSGEGLKPRLLVIKTKDWQPLGECLGDGWPIREDDRQCQRCLSQPVFHQEWANGYAGVIVAYTERMLQSWSAGETRDIHDEMTRLTAKIVMAIVFDLDVTDYEAERVAHTLDQVIAWFDDQRMADTLVVGSDQNRQNAIALLDHLIYAMIDCHRSQGSGRDDLLNLLMQVQNVDDGSPLSDQQLRDDVVMLMLAGYETTANTLSWIWRLLLKHPYFYSELTAELKTVLHGRAPTIADLPQLAHTRWVIEEAMRIYPSVTDLIGEATQAWEIGSDFISNETMLLGCQPVRPHNPQGSTEPHLLQPERQNDDLEQGLPCSLGFPASDGVRISVGKRFALTEAMLILATIAQKFQLNLGPNPAMAQKPSITLQLKRDIRVELLAA